MLRPSCSSVRLPVCQSREEAGCTILTKLVTVGYNNLNLLITTLLAQTFYTVSLIRMTDAPETGVTNRLRFSDAGFPYNMRRSGVKIAGAKNKHAC